MTRTTTCMRSVITMVPVRQLWHGASPCPPALSCRCPPQREEDLKKREKIARCVTAVSSYTTEHRAKSDDISLIQDNAPELINQIQKLIPERTGGVKKSTVTGEHDLLESHGQGTEPHRSEDDDDDDANGILRRPCRRKDRRRARRSRLTRSTWSKASRPSRSGRSGSFGEAHALMARVNAL
ncbi:hypothetical protein BJV78DRAFT_673862 [Lactifluus subvellereus]|nr:hypothetical protein BJV78DRAFT_673862 [Lactifluus subvellereus]